MRRFAELDLMFLWCFERLGFFHVFEIEQGVDDCGRTETFAF